MLLMPLQDPALEEGLEEAEQRMQPGSIKHALFHVSKPKSICIHHLWGLVGSLCAAVSNLHLQGHPHPEHKTEVRDGPQCSFH